MSIEKPAIFFDRDGVLNEDHGYIYEKENFIWVDGAVEAIKYLNKQGYLIFVVTNQSGIARGYFAESDLERLHSWVNKELREVGAKIDKFYYCPHHPQGIIKKYVSECLCRKPKPGMLIKAIEEWPIFLNDSFLIGDKETDILAAKSIGLEGYLFEGGNLFDFLKGKNI